MATDSQLNQCSLRIQGLYPALTGSERRAADFLLANPEAVLSLTVSGAANAIGISGASVTRFCRRLGYTGYRDLRLQLAREQGEKHGTAKAGVFDLEVSARDRVDEIPSKVIGSTILALENTLKVLDLGEYKRALDALVRASHIDVYGVSGSASIAHHTVNRLIRLGIRCQAFSDPHEQLMSATLLTARDVAIGISHSGRTKDTVEALSRAKQSGATTICIANYPDTPITKAATIQLMTASFETHFQSDRMVSRISQLAIVDTLFMGAFLRRHRSLKGRMAVVEEVLADKLY